MVDKDRIVLAVWESLINTQKQDGTFVPNRDIPLAIAEAFAEYERQNDNAKNIG